MKTKKFIRSGPHLPVRNLKLTLAWYRDELGFYEDWTFGEADGGIKRDEMRLLFGEDPDFTEKINGHQSRLPLLWFVDNIEAVYAEFNEKKIEMASPLSDHEYGLREFTFIDINR